MQRLRLIRRGASGQALLLYLNTATWEGRTGDQLAQEVREVLRSGFGLLLLHECDPQRGASEFAHFFAVTPADLITSGIYKKIAVPLHPDAHRPVSTATALIDLRPS